ncbi:MAG TPA: PBP1A family penicillin-binding protein [Chloroflexota bacterium]|nr:PBP1A family penicillin-binding protein [Chloroflexota bacterium]
MKRYDNAQRLVLHRRVKRPPKRGVPLLVLIGVFNFLFITVMGCGTAMAGGGATVYAFNTIRRDLPDPKQLDSLPLPQVTRLYDRTGQHLLYEFYEERRIAVPLRDVAPVMLQATLAIEDANFYQHRGFDPKGILRAALDNFRTGETVGGASTITQQLVKRMLLSDEQTYIRKLREILLATQVDALYSKDKILEMYLNQVYYGNQAYGVEAAALSYFGKSARTLDLAEASLLAGLVQLPSRYDPVTNPESAFARQRQVLDRMVLLGYASPEEADAAAARARTFTYRMQESNITHPHFSFFVKEQLQQRINPEVLRGGLTVITTLDVDANDRAQQIIKRRVDEIRWQKVNNGSLVALNPKTGEILAMVGSYDFNNKAIDGYVNVATAPRQPGSSFKAFTYAAAFLSKRFYPSSMVTDVPLKKVDISNTQTGFYEPKNYDLKYHGTVSFRSALSNSYNIPALLVQDAIGTPELIKMARTLGITTELPSVPSLTLGAGVVRLLDMTSAYGVFANQGRRVEPTPFLKITDAHGNVIYELGEPRATQVIPSFVAYQIADVLSDVAARRPAFGNVLDLAAAPDTRTIRTAAVKTGTTNDYKDSWTIGFTPSLVTGVWVGNTDNSAMLQVAGSLGAGYIWKDFIDQTFRGQPDEKFPMPPDAVRAPICPGQRATDVFAADGVPRACPPTLVPSREWQGYIPPELAPYMPRGVVRR